MMKKPQKLVTSLLALILAGVLLSSCGDEELRQKVEKQKEDISILKDSIQELNKKLGQNGPVGKPKNIITLEQADTLYSMYTRRAAQINDIVIKEGGPRNFTATRSLFYDLESLYNYLAYVKNKSKEVNIEPSGLRFYYGIYPDDYPRDESKYARRTTFFIAPTKKVVDADGNVAHIAYTLGEDSEEILLGESFVNKKRQRSYSKAGFFNLNLAGSQLENSLIANELQGSPPNNHN